jgi:Protein of unknown function (DUF1501)
MNATIHLARRRFLGTTGLGIGNIALGSLLNSTRAAATSAAPTLMAARAPHHPARARRVIYLFQGGGPSQLDIFDCKPMLRKFDGQPAPADRVRNQRFAFIKPNAAIFASPFNFNKHGQSGAEISDAMPHLAKVADNIAIVRSMVTDAFNHAPGQLLMNTGAMQFGRPSMGAWVTYGLGSEASNLPAYVVLSSGGGTSAGSANWGAGFLPTYHQGGPFRRTGDPILYLSNPRGVSESMQRESLDAIGTLNRERLKLTGDPEIATRTASYETAFRMQTSGPELMDISKESPETLALYGAKPGQSSYANNCLLARRLIERGVRFVQLNHETWDHHSQVVQGVKDSCESTDRANAALIQDLKRIGLLDETLVIWGGEFGRTPMAEHNPDAGRSMGRDHQPSAFTMWLAGGGIKPGLTLGATDDLGFHAIEDRVHVHDLHATVLHLLGLDHLKLTHRHQGRDFRLTDVHGELVTKLFT